jgi:hypothetical protein
MFKNPRKINMRGGYVKDSLLKVNESGLRTFTQIMDDGTTRGTYSFKDRKAKDIKAYRTPWMPVAHKIYTEKCNEHKDRTGEDSCPPMIVKVRETTLGNNKFNLASRQRQYYVIQQFYDEPRQIGRVVYHYEPRSWFMKWDETPEAFFTRVYGKRDAKRKHLPPIPDSYQNRVQAAIRVGPKNKSGVVTIDPDVPITEPAPKKGRVRRGTRANLEEQMGVERVFETDEIISDTPRITSRQQTPVTSGRSSKTVTPATSGRSSKTVTPATSGRQTSKAVLAVPEIQSTITFNLDGQLFDTQIPADADPIEIMDEILAQQQQGDAELLATILVLAEDPSYADLILEEEDRLVIDPNEELNGEFLVEVIDNQKPRDMSLAQYLAELDVESYKGPGSFSQYFETEDEPVGSPRLTGPAESRATETTGTGSGSESGDDDETSRFAGERGQRYLESVLERLAPR